MRRRAELRFQPDHKAPQQRRNEFSAILLGSLDQLIIHRAARETFTLEFLSRL